MSSVARAPRPPNDRIMAAALLQPECNALRVALQGVVSLRWCGDFAVGGADVDVAGSVRVVAVTGERLGGDDDDEGSGVNEVGGGAVDAEAPAAELARNVVRRQA